MVRVVPFLPQTIFGDGESFLALGRPTWLLLVLLLGVSSDICPRHCEHSLLLSSYLCYLLLLFLGHC